MYRINKSESNNAVNNNLKNLRKSDKSLALLLRKVYTNIVEREYTTIPATSEELLAVYNGQEDILTLDAGVLLLSVDFEIVPEIETVEVPQTASATSDYASMSVQELTKVLFADLGSEDANAIVSMATGLNVKLEMLDVVKNLLQDSFPEKRIEVLEARLANALALVKKAKGDGGALHITGGNLTVYDYLTSTETVDSSNYLFMASMTDGPTTPLDISILDSAFKSYKTRVSTGLLPVPPKELAIAISKAIHGIVEVKEDNKNKVLAMTF